MVQGSVHQRVFVVGGGIAGSVFALLLKQKGWQPIILEKVKNVGASGLALVLQANGLKILNKAGAIDIAFDNTLPWTNWNDWTHEGEFLGGPGSSSPAEFIDRYGWPTVGMSRTQLQLGLKSACEKAGIPFFEGWKLKDVLTGGSSVTIVSEDGQQLEGAFVVGADGLKSATRDVIFAKNGHIDRQPSFTGIEVIGGLSPSPQFLKDRQGANMFWGPTETIVTHPIEDEQHLWGATIPMDNPSPESWHTLTPQETESVRQKYLDRWASWHPVVAELVRTSTKMQYIGLYDRGDLEVDNWYHDRVTVIGDAAHPMTPHAGQGANQAIEDAWALFENLPNYDASHPITNAELTKIFRLVAQERQPLTSAVMHKALQWGEDRVLRGGRATEEGEKSRNAVLIKKWNDVEMLRAEQDAFLAGPFEDIGGYKSWSETR